MTLQANLFVIDDNQTNSYLLRHLLTHNGYDVKYFEDGETALAALSQETPDLILLDILMPGISGYEVCRRLKANSQTQEIPVIFLSALDNPTEKAKAFKLGGVDYIPKPFHKEEVLARIDNQLRLQIAQQQLQGKNQQLQQFSHHLKQLHRLNTATYPTPKALFQDYLVTACQVLNCSVGILVQLEDQGCRLESTSGPTTSLQPQDFPWEVVVAQQETVVTQRKGESLGTYIGTPVWVKGKIHGVLNFLGQEAPPFEQNPYTQEVLELMAQSLGRYITTHQAEVKRQRAETALLDLTTKLDERVRDRTAQLQATTEQLQAVLDAVPGFISWIEASPDAEGQFCYLGVNRQLADYFSLTPEDFCEQPIGFLRGESRWTALIEEFFRSDATTYSEVIDLAKGDYLQHYLVVIQKYHHHRAAVAVGIDITARVETEYQLQQSYQRLQLLSEVTLKIRQSLDIEAILQTTVSEMQSLLNADQVCVVKESRTGEMVVKSAFSQLPVLTSFPFRQFYQVYTEAFSLNWNNGLAIPDLATILTPCSLVQTLLAAQVRGILIVPIIVEERWGYLVVQTTTPRWWLSAEIEILSALADQISIAISQGQLLNHLEERVALRTAELSQANEQLQIEMRDRVAAETALRRNEQQLRLITNALPVLISYADVAGYYRFNNQTYAEWLNRPLEQITNQPVQAVLADYYPTLQPYIATALAGEATSFETEFVSEQGQIRYVSITYIPDFDPTGQVKGYFGIAIDISERIAVEKMKDEFLAIASHELRTPLTSIRGSLGLLATGRLGELSDKGKRMLEIAVNNSDRLSRLLNDILDLERIASGKVAIFKQLCNPYDLVTQAIEAMQSMADQNQVILNPQLSQNSSSIWADPDQILQTLTNLISNAIKFSFPQAQVIISLTEQSQHLRFAIQDQGRGIPPDKLEAIFGRFQQVDASDSREKSGTGLGLPICKEIIQRHNGEIWVESTLGKGSTFYFTLPKPHLF